MRVQMNGYIVADEDAWIYRCFGYQVCSHMDIRRALAENPPGETLTVEVNNSGGSMFAGFEIYSVLRGAQCPTEAEIQSLSASAASIAMLGCQRVKATPVAQVMIHNPAILAEGNQYDHQKTAEDLEKFAQSILNAYELKCRGKRSRESLQFCMIRLGRKWAMVCMSQKKRWRRQKKMSWPMLEKGRLCVDVNRTHGMVKMGTKCSKTGTELTKMGTIKELLTIARAELGYLEKASNAQLDSKTANAGDKNWTKYARDLDTLGVYNGPKNGYAWCAVFVFWCLVQAFGLETALKMTGQKLGGYGAGCTELVNYYRAVGRFHKADPQPGDQIFFSKDGGKTFYHTGIVERVQGGKVYTIEGNTSSAAGVVENGGAVRDKSYSLGYSRIGGYGRPDYSLVKEEDDMVYYKTLADVPSWYKPAVQKAVNKGALNGTGNGEINVSEDLCRTLTVLDRLGKLD